MERKTPLRAKKFWNPKRKPIKQIGKRGKLRQAGNREVDRELVKHGITRCEFKFPGCWGTIQGRAHSRKGRNIVGEDQWAEAAAACNHCHLAAEMMPEKEMGDLIRKIIANR